MKKGFPLLILLLVVFVAVVIVLQKAKGRIGADFTQSLPNVSSQEVTKIPSAEVAITTKSIFVPYWSLTGKKLDTDSYDSVVYFGVAAGKDGIDTDEPGYTKLSLFTDNVSSDNTLLTLRMIDRDKTLAVLKDKSLQKALISQTLALAKEHGFSGVVLDLELSALPFDSLIKQITDFTTTFSAQAKERDLGFMMTVYGDTFYRIRPFDIASLAKEVDSFFIMSYDFHKAGGNPGPNFPLHGKEVYGYDFETMLTHFLSYVPARRMNIIYGMFGYDWPVDGKGNATGTGEAKSILLIKKNIIANCEVLKCQSERDKDSSEMRVAYTAADQIKHIVWYEDEVSVAKKEALARSMGIGAFSFWAYSFF